MNTIRFLASASLVGAVALAGCASPADKQAMTVDKNMSVATQHPYSVVVTTSGGAETGAMTGSNIANADLKAAIESSIKETRVFREVLQGKDGQYELVVNVVSLSRPSFGLTFTVDLEAGWTLTRSSDKQIVYRKSIMSSGTATTGDAFVAATRLRLAIEAAARANITQGLTAIGQLVL